MIKTADQEFITMYNIVVNIIKLPNTSKIHWGEIVVVNGDWKVYTPM